MPKKFKPSECHVQKVWCGKGSIPFGNGYSRVGTTYECLQQGIGAGMYSEKRKNLPFDSLQQISYVGETHELSFRENGIKNLTQLRLLKKKSSSEIKSILSKILKKKNGQLDVRAYNSVLLWLYESGVTNLPSCQKD